VSHYVIEGETYRAATVHGPSPHNPIPWVWLSSVDDPEVAVRMPVHGLPDAEPLQPGEASVPNRQQKKRAKKIIEARKRNGR